MSAKRDKTVSRAPLCAILRKPQKPAQGLPRVPGLECSSNLSEMSEEEFEDLLYQTEHHEMEVAILIRRTRGGLQQILEVFTSQDKAASYVQEHFFTLWPEPLEVCQFCCREDLEEEVRWAYATRDLGALSFALGVPISFFFSLTLRQVR